MMEEVNKSKTAMDIFIKHSHHRNMTVLFLVQKLYGRTHIKKVISQNAHLMILFKNPRDASNVQILRQQMYPGNHLCFSLRCLLMRRRGHTVTLVNSHQRADDRMRVIGNLFEPRPQPQQYIYPSYIQRSISHQSTSE